MPALHLVFQSPTEDSALQHNIVGRLGEYDAVLLLCEGVYAAYKMDASFLSSIDKKVTVYVLLPDMVERGLEMPSHSTIKSVDYSGFVSLTMGYYPIISWF